MNKENENLRAPRYGNDFITDVMPSFIHEVEKEAYLMINAYGKIEAEKVAIGYANDWIKEINELKHYDGEKIKRMGDRKWYWLTVASAIKNWA